MTRSLLEPQQPTEPIHEKPLDWSPQRGWLRDEWLHCGVCQSSRWHKHDGDMPPLPSGRVLRQWTCRSCGGTHSKRVGPTLTGLLGAL